MNNQPKVTGIVVRHLTSGRLARIQHDSNGRLVWFNNEICPTLGIRFLDGDMEHVASPVNNLRALSPLERLAAESL